MKVYITDEIAYEISEHDVPDQLAETGPGANSSPRWATMTPQEEMGRAETIRRLDDAHLIGAIEGWLARNVSPSLEPDESTLLDDSEYPAKRRIYRVETHNEYGYSNETIVLEARFGRNKKWVMAVNRRIPELGRIVVMEWIDNETREDGTEL